MLHRYSVWTALFVGLAVTASRGVICAAEPPAVNLPAPRDPAVEAILATNPRTPMEWTRAAKILADLGEPALAKGFLKKVLGANLDQQQLIALQESFGSAIFLELASRGELAPEAQQLSDAVLKALARHLRDPARLAALVKQLQDPSAEARSQALVELQRARDAAIGPLVAVLADADRAAEHANVRAALVWLGSETVAPLIAVLEAPDPRLTVEAIRLLAALEAKQAVVFLLGPFASPQSAPEIRQAAGAALAKLRGATPSKSEAVRLLTEPAAEHFDRLRPLREDLDGQVELWTWDNAANQLLKQSYLAHDASLLLACRLAREAYWLAPDQNAVRRLYLATMLERSAYENGLDKPVEVADGTPGGQVAALGPEVVEDLLTYALQSGHAPAAAAAARILGQIGKAESLLCQGSRPAPLVEAACHGDRRVRFAAVEAILAMEPLYPFPGSSRVTEALGYFAASGEVPRVLVAAPGTAEARRVGGYLLSLGYELDTAVTGRDAVRQLFASPDYELALIDVAIQRPTLDFLLQELRHDCRTARLPVGVIAREGQLQRADHIAGNDSLAQAFPRPHTQDSVQWQVERLMALLGRERVAAAERTRQAAQALRWLADWSGRDQTVFDLRQVEDAMLNGLYTPGLGADAATVLGNLRTGNSQQALVEVASRWTLPIELRKAAVEAFRRNVQRNSILLTREQIRLQYDRYNQSETLDVGTQQVLGSILDAIEAPSRAQQPATKDLEENDTADIRGKNAA